MELVTCNSCPVQAISSTPRFACTLLEGHKIRNSNNLTLEDGEDNDHHEADHWLKSPNKIYRHIKITLRAQADIANLS